jgi:hypothetical protein
MEYFSAEILFILDKLGIWQKWILEPLKVTFFTVFQLESVYFDDFQEI